jgi:uncharacterized CHY-type Zn-finger protein
MICNKCKKLIPSGKLVCVACVEKASRIEEERYQQHPLRQYHEGQMQIRVVQLAGVRHLMMFGGTGEMAFCRMAITKNSARTTYFSSVELEKAVLCEGCKREFTRILAEAL